jgi:hypothetical protein
MKVTADVAGVPEDGAPYGAVALGEAAGIVSYGGWAAGGMLDQVVTWQVVTWFGALRGVREAKTGSGAAV